VTDRLNALDDIAHDVGCDGEDGRSYGFCCAGCRSSFAADPARYLATPERA
jgi:hypothetical protein